MLTMACVLKGLKTSPMARVHPGQMPDSPAESGPFSPSLILSWKVQNSLAWGKGEWEQKVAWERKSQLCPISFPRFQVELEPRRAGGEWWHQGRFVQAKGGPPYRCCRQTTSYNEHTYKAIPTTGNTRWTGCSWWVRWCRLFREYH